MRSLLKTFVVASLLSSLLVLVVFIRYGPWPKSTTSNAFNGNFTGIQDAYNETGFPYYIVPNIIHLVHFGKPEMSFGEMITIKSAFINHRPAKIMIHCDCSALSGEYWELVKDIPVLEVVFKTRPVTVFGQKLTWIQHVSDVARLQVLLQYGGIYLDSDVYVVSSLDRYRKFEFALGWDYGQYIGSQVLVAHRNARFLRLYYESFRDYRGDLWYYNAGELPTKSILYKQPYLVHRVPVIFGVDNKFAHMLYSEKTDQWRDFVTIHLLLRLRRRLVPEDPVEEFNMNTIRSYNRTFGDMAREVLFGTTNIVGMAK